MSKILGVYQYRIEKSRTYPGYPSASRPGVRLEAERAVTLAGQTECLGRERLG